MKTDFEPKPKKTQSFAQESYKKTSNVRNKPIMEQKPLLASSKRFRPYFDASKAQYWFWYLPTLILN